MVHTHCICCIPHSHTYFGTDFRHIHRALHCILVLSKARTVKCGKILPSTANDSDFSGLLTKSRNDSLGIEWRMSSTYAYTGRLWLLAAQLQYTSHSRRELLTSFHSERLFQPRWASSMVGHSSWSFSVCPTQVTPFWLITRDVLLCNGHFPKRKTYVLIS